VWQSVSANGLSRQVILGDTVLPAPNNSISVDFLRKYGKSLNNRIKSVGKLVAKDLERVNPVNTTSRKT
jgi:hypothetical protein